MAERLDLADGFDVHDYRSHLKLDTQDGSSMYLENRKDLKCPACGRAFDRLFVSEDDRVTFGNPPDAPFCLARTAEKLLLMTH
ncbi:flagella cluster protein [Haloplanus litoreus]|uniref:Flagella cluster protein n=1 Tax=Haloplanus litoreus TaxID=767515 RepID=A0ABD5ZWM1_9EURY